MLLGYRVSQKSILWPLVAVMLPGWLLLAHLVRRPEANWHTQMVLHDRLSVMLSAYDHAVHSDPPSLGSLRARVEELLSRAERAGLMKNQQWIEASIMWLHFGDADKAAFSLSQVKNTDQAGPWFPLAEKAVHGLSLDKAESDNLRALLENRREDWWAVTLARLLHAEAGGTNTHVEALAWWRLRVADWFMPGLLILAACLTLPAWRLLNGPWTIWPYSERVQRLWPVALMLCVLSLRGLFMLLAGSFTGIIVPLISWAGQRDPVTVYHIQTVLSFGINIVVVTGLTCGMKEALAAHWGTLEEVLGFDRKEAADPRLWCIAIPCAAAVFYSLEPLSRLFDAWTQGGTGLYDGLSRSPGGYGLPGTCLAVLQSFVVAPVIEEITYRGFLLSALRTAFGNAGGAALSSLLFALATGASPAGMTVAFAQACLYAAIRLHTGRLAGAIVTHACVGMMTTVYALLAGG